MGRGYSDMVSGILERIVIVALWAASIRGIRYMLKRMKMPMLQMIKDGTLIDVPSHGHFVIVGNSEQNISFRIDIKCTSPIAIKILGISYKILYDYKVIQQRKVKKSIEMKANTRSVRIDLLYYPVQSPLGIPLSADKWDIKGQAIMDCYYGRFVKTFSSSRRLTVTSDNTWEETRSKHKKTIEGI